MLPFEAENKADVLRVHAELFRNCETLVGVGVELLEALCKERGSGASMT